MLANRGKGLVLVTQKEDLAPVPFWIIFDFGDAVQYSALKVGLVERPDDPGQAGVQDERKVEGDNLAFLYQFRPARKRAQSFWAGATEVRGFGRAEDPLHIRIVVKKRKEHRDAFDD